MVRPKKCRQIRLNPVARLFKPQGIPARQLEEALLSEEELEALCLADCKGLDHETAAASMAVSRSTFSRILAKARKTVAKALVQGKTIKIEGGTNQHIDDETFSPTDPT